MDQQEYDDLNGRHGAVLASKILDWLVESGDTRPFHRRDIISDLALIYKGELEYQSMTHRTLNRALKTLCASGQIEPVPGKSFGWYRPVIKELNAMDPFHAEGQDVDIWLPLSLSDHVKLFPGDIAILAGSPNVGKTAFTLNVAKENALKGWEVHYFNSEMSDIELRERLEMFMSPETAWSNVNFYARSEHFQDVVFPGKNIINIIDFLQVHTDFYAIGATLFEIHKRLKDSICIINMQKNPGNDTALGGFRTLELPRLAVAIDFQVAKLVKAKAWRDKNKNPNGASCDFKLIHGHNLVPKNGVSFVWRAEMKKMKEGVK